MRKIDLHIHTIPMFRDAAFEFDLETFNRYVKEMRLDAVAVTNHDLFDGKQFHVIQQALEVVVFPGIEVCVDKGHVLLFTDPKDLKDFQDKANRIASLIKKETDTISIDELMQIYGDLGRYLVIPHYEKGPAVSGEALERLLPFVSAGEVDSAKKFVRAMRDNTKLTPVLFSDLRIAKGLTSFPTRQTFVDCGELTLSALRSCLRDKAKVVLSETEGNKVWQVLDDGLKLSTGLNVLIGARSSGKTHTLEKIAGTMDSVKHIRQFELVQENDELCEREFEGNVERRRSTFSDDYLSGLKNVVDGVADVDLQESEKKLERYLETLIKSAQELDRKDAYSKAGLFDEVEFAVGNTRTLEELIKSVRQVIENVEFRSVIEKHVDLQALKDLALELIAILRATDLDRRKKAFVNQLVGEVKKGLKVRTSAVQIENADLYSYCMDVKRVQRFNEIVGLLKQEAVVYRETIQGFRIEAQRSPYRGALEIKLASGTNVAFSEAFRAYSDPYRYLQVLLEEERLTRSELYRLFVKINFKILNKDGFEVSGGERSEFRLLQEISDAQKYDILLVDEPESSFDNLFLKSGVNQLLKDIAETMPVVVVTHNSTVGASAGPDYLLYARKEFEDGVIVYRVYSGYPTDKTLKSADGRTISSHETLMDSLEAGKETYEGRRRGYEALKD